MISLLNCGTFFQEFNFGTLLTLISCVTGVVALFLGGAAYHNCRIFKKSFNDEKKFEDDSQDRSQRAVGNIINNNGITDSQFTIFTTALTTLSSDNFSKAVDKAYATFRIQTEENMKRIVAEAERIVRESKWQIAGYTKIDWINIYFESAKNTSDPYMQDIWAKVLAFEMATPGTFSYKTLDVLKNMTSKDFQLFEKLASLQIAGGILNGDFLGKWISWREQLELQEMGLITLEDSESNIKVAPHDKNATLCCQETLAVIFLNDTDEEVSVKIPMRILTRAASELSVIATPYYFRDFFLEGIKSVRKGNEKKCKVELHPVNSVNDSTFSYTETDLLSVENN